MTATIAATAPGEQAARPPPRPVVLWTLAAAGAAAGASSIVFALTNEGIGPELGEPLVIALLSIWITLSYIDGGGTRLRAEIPCVP